MPITCASLIEVGRRHKHFILLSVGVFFRKNGG